MNKNLNRRKFIFFNFKKISYTFLIISITLLLFFFYSKKENIKITFFKIIENFSKHYNYQLVNLNINGTIKIEKKNLEKNLEYYLNSSIFLLPLDKISKNIKENNWIKSIKLSTNYKDTLFINIEEYEPIGFYHFNNKFFFFDHSGKIIDQVFNILNEDDLIIFSGQLSNIHAKKIIKILDNFDFKKKFKINKITYVNKRRWDIYINDKIKLMLSENKPEDSIKNFLIIKENLSKTEFNNIEFIDLRNIDKTVITFNK